MKFVVGEKEKIWLWDLYNLVSNDIRKYEYIFFSSKEFWYERDELDVRMKKLH